MLILEIVIASIVLFIRERIAAKRENRKMNPWYAVVLGVKELVEWILSDEGQKLIEECGYVALY